MTCNRALILCAALLAPLLHGCATPQGNAALFGAIVGAGAATAVYHSRQPHCLVKPGRYIGRDRWGYPVYGTVTVCR